MNDFLNQLVFMTWGKTPTVKPDSSAWGGTTNAIAPFSEDLASQNGVEALSTHPVATKPHKGNNAITQKKTPIPAEMTTITSNHRSPEALVDGISVEISDDKTPETKVPSIPVNPTQDERVSNKALILPQEISPFQESESVHDTVFQADELRHHAAEEPNLETRSLKPHKKNTSPKREPLFTLDTSSEQESKTDNSITKEFVVENTAPDTSLSLSSSKQTSENYMVVKTTPQTSTMISPTTNPPIRNTTTNAQLNSPYKLKQEAESLTPATQNMLPTEKKSTPRTSTMISPTTNPPIRNTTTNAQLNSPYNLKQEAESLTPAIQNTLLTEKKTTPQTRAAVPISSNVSPNTSLPHPERKNPNSLVVKQQVQIEPKQALKPRNSDLYDRSTKSRSTNVHIHIGQIEVKSDQSVQAPPINQIDSSFELSLPKLSLKDYFAKRNEGTL